MSNSDHPRSVLNEQFGSQLTSLTLKSDVPLKPKSKDNYNLDRLANKNLAVKAMELGVGDAILCFMPIALHSSVATSACAMPARPLLKKKHTSLN